MFKTQNPEIVIEKIKYNLNKRKLTGNKISLKYFIQEFKRITCTNNELTIKKNIDNLIDLGYIKKLDVGILQFCVDINTPYLFEKEKIIENKEEVK